MKVEESLNVTFDETSPPKTPPLEDDELVKEEAIEKQTALAISTTETEYVSAEKACQQALWMKQALVDYGIRFMNYLEEQTNDEVMINSIKNGDQPLPCVTQASLAGTSSTEQPSLKDKSMWSDQEKKIHKIDRLARSLLIQGLANDIYSLIISNKTAKDLWDALARHMLGSKYREQDRKAVVLYDHETFKATEGELKVKVVVSSESEGSDDELKKITALLAKAFNQKKFYSKPTNNNLRTSSATSSANKKQ
nr:retrovirus-related Pol polyprotein from transposon TNT 1-94 [Tanacetum cinerariifolium]